MDLATFLYKHLYLYVLVVWSNFPSSKCRRTNWAVESLNTAAQGYKANEWLSDKVLSEVREVHYFSTTIQNHVT